MKEASSLRASGAKCTVTDTRNAEAHAERISACAEVCGTSDALEWMLRVERGEVITNSRTVAAPFFDGSSDEHCRVVAQRGKRIGHDPESLLERLNEALHFRRWIVRVERAADVCALRRCGVRYDALPAITTEEHRFELLASRLAQDCECRLVATCDEDNSRTARLEVADERLGVGETCVYRIEADQSAREIATERIGQAAPVGVVFVEHCGALHLRIVAGDLRREVAERRAVQRVTRDDAKNPRGNAREVRR